MSVNPYKHKMNTQDVILSFCNKVAVFLRMIYGFINFLVFSKYWLDHGFYELSKIYSQIWYIGIWSSRVPLTFDGFLTYSIDKIYAIYYTCKSPKYSVKIILTAYSEDTFFIIIGL